MLTRLNVMLLALLVLSALSLVTSQHRARKLFIEVERAVAHEAAHEVRWNQLQVEQTELAKSARIDSRARGELGMEPVSAERTLHLSIDPATRQVSLSQPWRETPEGRGARGPTPTGAVPRAAAASGAAPRAAAASGTAPRAAAASGTAPRAAAASGTGPRPAVASATAPRPAAASARDARPALSRNAGKRAPESAGARVGTTAESGDVAGQIAGAASRPPAGAAQ